MNQIHSNAKHLADGRSPDQPIVVEPPFQFLNCEARKLKIRKGHLLSERAAWAPVTLTVVSGNCEVRFEDAKQTISSGQQLEIPVQVPHELFALEDCRLVVTLAIAGSRSR